MANLALEKYIAEARSKNISDELLREKLVKSGWPVDEVDSGLKPTTADSLDLPPPPVPHFSLWVTFQYVILFITLYVSATSFAGILHHGVDTAVPDRLSTSNPYDVMGFGLFYDSLLKGYIAGILVTFPVFGYLFVVLRQQLVTTPGVRNLKARKNLIYATLVVTFVIMIGHLIGTIYGFLNGTTTLRSLGHLGVNFLVAGSIFYYLLGEVKEDRKTS
jgi:hypothetical protein